MTNDVSYDRAVAQIILRNPLSNAIIAATFLPIALLYHLWGATLILNTGHLFISRV
jgi:hypothetical protein